MRIQDLARPTRFMFWCTAPFFVTTFALMPWLASPVGTAGWVVLAVFEVFGVLALLGLYDADRFDWCWRAVGGLVFVAYLSNLISTVVSGQWIGDGRRSSRTALNALMGLIVFGYPGFMYAFLGRFTWRAQRVSMDHYQVKQSIETASPLEPDKQSSNT